MQSPSPVAPTLEEGRALADWAFKISLVFGFIAAGTERVAPEVRASFFRTHQAPDHAAVAIGATSFTYANALYGQRTGSLPFPGVGKTRVFTLLLKHVVIQVAFQCDGQRVLDPLDLLPLRAGARLVLHPERHPPESGRRIV